MKKMIVLFLAGFLLVGCQETEVQEEAEVEPWVDDRPLYVSNAKPRSLYIDENGVDINSQIVLYCWGKVLSECPTELTKSPKEALENNRKIKVNTGNRINLIIDIDPSNPLPFPDQGELYLYENDKYTLVEVQDNSFNLPNVEGIYTYVYKVIYDSDVKGITFYAFDANVRN